MIEKLEDIIYDTENQQWLVDKINELVEAVNKLEKRLEAIEPVED